MELLQQYIGEITLGLTSTFITIFVKGYQSLIGRIKKLEDSVLKLKGDLDMNTALDNERKEK